MCFEDLNVSNHRKDEWGGGRESVIYLIWSQDESGGSETAFSSSSTLLLNLWTECWQTLRCICSLMIHQRYTFTISSASKHRILLTFKISAVSLVWFTPGYRMRFRWALICVQWSLSSSTCQHRVYAVDKVIVLTLPTQQSKYCITYLVS